MEVVNEMVVSGCLEDWKADLDVATNALKIAEADALKAQTTYDNAAQWAAKLHDWQDNLAQTVALTETLESELFIFKTQIRLVSKSTDSIVDAINILYCEVKKVFDGSNSVESLSNAVRGMQEVVYCLGNPANLNKNGGFLKKLTELEAKIKTVEDIREDVLKKLIAMVQSVNGMETAICDDSDGLQGIITMLHCEFSVGDTSDEAAEDLATLRMPRNCGCLGNDEGEHSCDSELSPTISFPLKDDDFVKGIRAKHATAATEKDTASETYNKSRQKRDRLLAKKNGLEKAIAAATAAKK